LKPENILISENLNQDGTFSDDPQERYTAKIADFGLSAEVQSNVFHGQDNMTEVMGTILFMAPEQAQGKRYGKRIDMWALGIIVYQMLTGKHPFYHKGDTEQSYIDRIAKGQLDIKLKENFQKYNISILAQSFL
jgi:serine/threonine protein kinase